MSQIDEIFIKRCKEILETTEIVKGNRAKWEDGTFANTKHICNVVNVYDVGKEFPIPTLRQHGIKSAIAEVLWIFQQKSNNIKDLVLNGKQLHIWDQWADENGTIGKAYGYQIGKPFRFIKTNDGVMTAIAVNRMRGIVYPSLKIDNDGWVWIDQMDSVLFQLYNSPTSRRIMTHTFNFDELADMGLQPCAYSTTWTVENGKLNLLLNQRSQDMLAASFWNVIQYSALLVMVARATGFEVGKLTHVIADCHIYDRHIPIIEELINRPTFLAPTVTFSPAEDRKCDFYQFSANDWTVGDYKYGASVGKFEVAI